MTVAAVTMVKDEADIIASTVGHMAGQVDMVIVADNGSTDGTRDILDGLDVIVIDDPEIGYYQSRKITALAHRAMAQGADWIVPFDADEWWTTSTGGRITDFLAVVDPMWQVVSAPTFDHVPTGEDPDDPDPTRRIVWRRATPNPLPKVACRTAADLTIAQGNHSAHYEAPAPTLPDGLIVHHFPYRSAEQFARKATNGAAAYAATDLPEDMGRHWRDYGRIASEHGDEALEAVFRRWFWQPDVTGLVHDPVC
jgi:glycosyltransferase involved in cell wall biosynthesis